MTWSSGPGTTLGTVPWGPARLPAHGRAAGSVSLRHLSPGTLCVPGSLDLQRFWFPLDLCICRICATQGSLHRKPDLTTLSELEPSCHSLIDHPVFFFIRIAICKYIFFVCLFLAHALSRAPLLSPPPPFTHILLLQIVIDTLGQSKGCKEE